MALEQSSLKRQCEGPGDRAQKKRKTALGIVRIPLEKIGFWPENRGGMGLSSYHVHEVALDCMQNTTKITRYNFVDLIEIPDNLKNEILAANRRECETDPLMPRFSEAIQYVCGPKTHLFTHTSWEKKAGALCSTGAFLPSAGKTEMLRPKIREHGPLCAIYEKDLFDDHAAIVALASDDNLNASIQWSEDEMQAFGRVHNIMEEPDNAKADEQTVLNHLQVSGLGVFTTEDWKHFITLRRTLTPASAKILQAIQFHVASGRVRVKAADFGTTARLDPRARMAMVAVILHQPVQ